MKLKNGNKKLDENIMYIKQTNINMVFIPKTVIPKATRR